LDVVGRAGARTFGEPVAQQQLDPVLESALARQSAKPVAAGRQSALQHPRVPRADPQAQLHFVAEDDPEMTPAAAAVLARIVRTLRERRERTAA
jgi:hypothetical protein